MSSHQAVDLQQQELDGHHHRAGRPHHRPRVSVVVNEEIVNEPLLGRHRSPPPRRSAAAAAASVCGDNTTFIRHIMLEGRACLHAWEFSREHL